MRWSGRAGRRAAAVTEFADKVLRDAASLVWRVDCPACARTEVTEVSGGAGLCRDCAVELRRLPERTGAAGVLPIVAAGPYGGAHRAVVLAAKDHHRPDAVTVMGEVFAGVVRHLAGLGEVPDPRLAPVVLLPAPTRPSAARARGGCVVERAAQVAAAGLGGAAVCCPVACLEEGTPDSVGLGRATRAVNMSRAVRLRREGVTEVLRILRTPGAVACVVDDVCTTGATLTTFSLALATYGVFPRVGVVVAQA